MPDAHRILIIDDAPTTRRLLRILLEGQDYKVIEANDGPEGIEKARTEQPDLIFLDVMMPGMNGFEVCRQLMAEEETRKLPVIFVSAKNRAEDKVEGLDTGAVDYIAKPFNSKEVLARVRAALRPREGGGDGGGGEGEAAARVQTLEKEMASMGYELDQAGEIQRSMLPRAAPESQGVKAFGKMRPRSEIGGDYFDFVERADNLIICIGDVSGKGVPAALVMVMARTFLNHWDVNVLDTKMSLLALNQQILANSAAEIFMSMVLFKWDEESQVMKYTGAGHEHLFIYRAATREVEQIRCGGQVLGLRANILGSLEEKELPLDPGDTIMLYTDGVTEAVAPDGDMFGLERLRESFELHATKEPEPLVEAIFMDTDVFAQGHKQVDDITVVVIKRT